MPIVYRIDAEQRRIEIVAEGELGDSDLVGETEQIRKDPEFRPEFDQLIDLSGAAGTKISSEAVRGLAHRPPLFSPRSRRALVVATDLGFGLARMFQTIRDGEAGEIQIFRSVDEARAWLEGE